MKPLMRWWLEYEPLTATAPLYPGSVSYTHLALAPQPLTYLDYAWFLASQTEEPGRLDYWTKALTPLPEALELPVDFARSRDFDFQGNTISFSLSPQLSCQCDAFCAQHGLSPYLSLIHI